MNLRRHFQRATFLILAAALQNVALAETKVAINSDFVLTVNGQKIFPIGFSIPPPLDGKAPNGKSAFAELASAGGTFIRTGPEEGSWNERSIAQQQQWLDTLARNGMYSWLNLKELSAIQPGTDKHEATLRAFVNRFKDHPGLLIWKGADEPEWGKRPVPPLVRAREIVKELDPNHPLVIIQAPRGSVETLRPYNAAADIVGLDIYPIGYPPGAHSLGTNKNISMVGDFTQEMMAVSENKLPVWMTLQICWSGVIKPGKTLRFPTFPEERFMSYQAIINGARGLIYFGGGIESAMNPRDAKLGWNWTFWERVLRPVIEELGPNSPLRPALVAPNSKLPLKVSGADGVEFCVREVGKELFILACKREGATAELEFSGLPASVRAGEVLFESPRTVKSGDGKFKDWFAPFEVHVYRFSR